MMESRDRYLVFYDAACRLCRRSRLWLERLDWRRKLDFVDLHDREALGRLLPAVPYAALVERMHVLTPSGRVRSGFEAFRAMLPALPGLWPLLPLVWLPGMRTLGTAVYDWVARRRSHSLACTDEACVARRSSPP